MGRMKPALTIKVAGSLNHSLKDYIKEDNLKSLLLIMLALLLSACSGEGASQGEDQNAAFEELKIYSFVGDVFVNPLSTPGGGTVVYSSSNENTALVNDKGSVSVVGPGNAIVSASISPYGAYEGGKVSFELSAIERNQTLFAWVGNSESEVILPATGGNMSLYISADSDCDVENYGACGSADVFQLNMEEQEESVRALTHVETAYIKAVHGNHVESSTLSPFVVSPRAHSQVVEFHGKLWMIGGDSAERYSDTASVLMSDNGVDWVNVHIEEEFAYRRGHSLVVFKDKLYMIAGHQGPTDNNDVWSSIDGLSWQKEPQISEFSRRGEQQIMVHDNKLWLIGGSADGIGSAEIWTSEDASEWTMLTDEAPFGPRLAHRVVEKDNKFWLIGGYTSKTPYNDVWVSTDLINWQLVIGNASWPARGHQEVIVYKDHFLLVGGASLDYQDRTVFSDVWRSKDGESWELVTDNATFGAISNHDLFIYDDEIHMLSMAQGDNGIPSSDVWKSKDGIKWDSHSRHNDIGARVGHRMVEHEGGIYLIGGRTGVENASSSEYLNDIWYSTDGLQWEKVLDSADFSPRSDFELISFNGELWLFGGKSENVQGEVIQLIDIWKSSDGVKWSEQESNSTFQICNGFDINVLGQQLWMTSGARSWSDNCASQFWVSNDGITWNDVKSEHDFPELELMEYRSFKGKIWAVGNLNDSEDVWSFDGESTWQAEILNGSCESDCFKRHNHYLLEHQNSLFMVSGLNTGYSDLLKMDVWKTIDGTSWSKITGELSNLLALNGATISFDGKVLIHGGFSQSEHGYKEGKMPVNRLWSSEDLINWKLGYQHTLRFEQ